MSNWIVMIFIGIMSLIAGIIALLNPFAASLTATLIAGWSFLILGALQIIAGLQAEGTGSKLLGTLIGLVALIIGINIVAKPMEGLITLTMIAGVMFLVSGIFKAWVGFANAEGPLRSALILSGLVSIVLGVMVLSNFPQSAEVVLGIMLGIELLSNGVSAIALALVGKNAKT
ncbi:HdeD family acid-resistance protein [Pseudopelagicola sp. nBUS_19]|uniref:HdeD family acid-resistance protein n=1 Tax=Pseudopelagicola sp. nBUS_19 TaxID=3395316 RepID=UPI003EBFEDB2